jgi:hypothetical protein
MHCTADRAGPGASSRKRCGSPVPRLIDGSSYRRRARRITSQVVRGGCRQTVRDAARPQRTRGEGCHRRSEHRQKPAARKSSCSTSCWSCRSLRGLGLVRHRRALLQVRSEVPASSFKLVGFDGVRAVAATQRCGAIVPREHRGHTLPEYREQLECGRLDRRVSWVSVRVGHLDTVAVDRQLQVAGIVFEVERRLSPAFNGPLGKGGVAKLLTSRAGQRAAAGLRAACCERAALRSPPAQHHSLHRPAPSSVRLLPITRLFPEVKNQQEPRP